MSAAATAVLGGALLLMASIYLGAGFSLVFFQFPGAGTITAATSAIALRWALAQKLGASIAMALGVRTGRVGRQALVGAVDGASAVLIAKLLLDARG